MRNVSTESISFNVSLGVSLGDFLLTPAYPIEKVTLRPGFLHLMSGSETDKFVAKGKGLSELEIEPSQGPQSNLQIVKPPLKIKLKQNQNGTIRPVHRNGSCLINTQYPLKVID